MKARISQFQEGLDFVCRNEGWKKIYENAPDGEKEQLELQFFDQWRESIGEPLDEDEYLKFGELCLTPLTKIDWEYELHFAKDPRYAAFLKRCIAEAKE